MTNIAEIAKKHGVKLSNGFYKVELSGFSEACYNDNSQDELICALAGNADSADMENWGITADEWRESIEAALAAKAIENNGDELPQ